MYRYSTKVLHTHAHSDLTSQPSGPSLVGPSQTMLPVNVLTFNVYFFIWHHFLLQLLYLKGDSSIIHHRTIASSFRTMRERRQLHQKNMILVTIAGIIINSRTLFAYSSEWREGWRVGTKSLLKSMNKCFNQLCRHGQDIIILNNFSVFLICNLA